MVRSTIQLGSKDVISSIYRDVADWQGIVGVAPDGFFGPITESATKRWQESNGLLADGIVGPITWETATRLETTEQEIPPMATLIGYPALAKLSGSDRSAFVKTANWIGVNPDYLAAVFKFESNFSTTVPNAAGSGATGVIQFMPDTAARIMLKRWPAKSGDPKPTAEEKALAIAKLKKMSFSQQLEWVKVYFSPWRNKLHTLEDTYLAVFYPKLIGKPLDTPVDDQAYAQNKGFDANQDGLITKREITSTIRGVYNSGVNLPRIAVPLIGLWAVFGSSAIAYTLYKLLGKS